MKTLLLCLALAGILIPAGFYGWRLTDDRADARERDRLLALQAQAPARFTQAMVADLPAPARRYFTFAIAEGTPLHTVGEITTHGRFAMGTQEAPNYVLMTATQILAAPEGFLWAMSGGEVAMRISGSDSARWTRFWLGGVVPVARAGGSADHARSGFGHYVSEALFWTPAAVLPSDHVTWTAIDDTRTRMTMTHGDLSQSVDP